MEERQMSGPTPTVDLTKPDDHTSEQAIAARDGDEPIRRVFSWVIVTGAAVFSVLSIVLLVRAGFRKELHASLYFSVMRDHFVAVVGLPMAAVAALFIVLVLRSTDGPLEFEALGVKLRGGSGPVVLWLVCFLGIVVALKLTWPELTFEREVPTYLIPHN
jgi:hypothetical protein